MTSVIVEASVALAFIILKHQFMKWPLPDLFRVALKLFKIWFSGLSLTSILKPFGSFSLIFCKFSSIRKMPKFSFFWNCLIVRFHVIFILISWLINHFERPNYWIRGWPLNLGSKVVNFALVMERARSRD